MSKVNDFKKWKSESMGHPYGVTLGYEAVKELESKLEVLTAVTSELAKQLDDNGHGDSEHILDLKNILEHG